MLQARWAAGPLWLSATRHVPWTDHDSTSVGGALKLKMSSTNLFNNVNAVLFSQKISVSIQ
jgi:hypothetical protein